LAKFSLILIEYVEYYMLYSA